MVSTDWLSSRDSVRLDLSIGTAQAASVVLLLLLLLFFFSIYVVTLLACLKGPLLGGNPGLAVVERN